MAMTVVAATAVFAVVQDRVTAAGARQYVVMQREAERSAAAPAAIDQVVAPAVAASVRQGFAWSGGVMAIGLTWWAVLSRSRRRE
jgi:hypothetical protein